ncbi:unnamed protein product, partial [Haemonchus placei]|uniref:Recep_L_domain domain-containing protein n=1 Tax=Haemonchus placei TaxID=6290 RepID=A0A0N4X8V5_HAEPC
MSYFGSVMRKKCKGGRFEELVTEELNNCSKVEGNLEFINMAEVPLSMNLLASVQKIKGALRIENSPAFTTFPYLSKLRRIENAGEGDFDDIGISIVHRPALTVENNENLEDIDFPSLKYLKSKNPPWIVIRNNPVLVLSGRFGEKLRDLKQKHKQLVVLDDASSILENATYIMDGNITAGEKIEKVLKRYENIIKENMIQVAENGSLSLVLGDTPRASKSQRLISERIQKMLVMKHVVLIGTEDDPSCVLPKIPTTPGKDRTYEYDTTKMTLRFKNSMEVSNNSRRFEYDAEFTSENKTRLFKLEFVYFVWGSLDLNVNVEELLRLLQFCKIPGHSLCVSNRHKEVFSLLNLFYSFVVRAETPIQLTDVFKIHNAKCNGCMLDRHEMIFSMKFLLVWGIQSGALPKLHQAANSWLDTYDGMAAFQKIHPNVVSFHPFFIPDLFPEDMEEIVKGGGCDPPKFSD